MCSATIKDWKVITLENDYLKVFVLPEAGGKVWGAIETARCALYQAMLDELK